MFVETKTETVQRKLRHMRHSITVTRHADVYKCDHCKREMTLFRFAGDERHAILLTCVCKHLVQIN